MFILNGLCAETDQQRQHRCAGEQDDGKVQVVDATNQERTPWGENTAARTKPELWQQPTQAHRQTTNQAPESPLRV